MDVTKAKFQHIPYAGGGPLLVGFLSGQVDVVLFDSVTILPHVKSGKARALAIVSEQRSASYPGVPTVKETVAPTLSSDFWLGIFAPARTPRDIVTKLNLEINAAMNSADIKAKVEAASMTVANESPESFERMVAHQWALWGQVICEKSIATR